MRVLVCGGRNFNDEDHVWNALLGVEQIFDRKIKTIISGGAKGADAGGENWAKVHGREIDIFPALWKELGRKAGPLRNQEMIDKGDPELVLAFPGGRGTADMVRRAKAANIAVIQIYSDLPEPPT